MSKNKKFDLIELKELVFNKNKAIKQNKDRLFKLAKSSEDLETIKKLATDFGFKSAKMHLDKIDKLSVGTAIKNRDFELFHKFVENGADISKIKVSDLIDKKYDDEFIKLFIEKDYYVNVAQLIKKKYTSTTIKLALEYSAKVDDIYENLTGIAHASNMVELI